MMFFLPGTWQIATPRPRSTPPQAQNSKERRHPDPEPCEGEGPVVAFIALGKKPLTRAAKVAGSTSSSATKILGSSP
jgi:hypothetical protein